MSKSTISEPCIFTIYYLEKGTSNVIVEWLEFLCYDEGLNWVTQKRHCLGHQYITYEKQAL